MYRYLALIFDDPEGRRSSFAQSVTRRVRSARIAWTVAHDSHGLIVFHAGQRAGCWQSYDVRGCGVVLGSLFRQRAAEEFSSEGVAISDRESRAIAETAGRSLVDGFWGRYVAVLRGARGSYHVVRDPTGIMPCHYIRMTDATIFFSELDDCVELISPRLSIDWRHVGAFLQSDRLVSSHTGFKEVVKLQAGECCEIVSGRLSSKFYWHPNEICRSEVIEDTGHALLALRRAVRTSVHSWGSCYRRILHGLSGGLDSSIVLACLAAAKERPDVVCSNMFTATAEGDERAYARKAAQRAGCKLVESLVRPFMTNPQRMLNASGIPSPELTTFVTEDDEFQAGLVREHGCEAIFSGQGGDHLFQVVVSNLIPAEYAHRHGMRGLFWRILWQTARTTKQPIWPALSASFAHGLLRRGIDPYRSLKRPSFLRDDVFPITAEDLRHPWVDESAGLPAAKLQQVYFLVDCQVLYSLICRYADIVHPLISQPVIECCLRIPSYVLTDGGKRNRALARNAFATDLPPEIVARTTKGAANSYFHNVILDHASSIRELLLDGILVREGLMDKTTLEEHLSEKGLISGTDMLFPIFCAIRAEGWLREATTLGQRAAA